MPLLKKNPSCGMPQEGLMGDLMTGLLNDKLFFVMEILPNHLN